MMIPQPLWAQSSDAENGSDVEKRGVEFRIKFLTLDANEGIAAGDVDGDGQTDLVAGRNWYRGPDWEARPLRSIEDWNGYVESNGDYLFDVNDDGRLDVVAGAFLPTEVKWFENPGSAALKLGQLWPPHVWADTETPKNEGQLFADIDGDGVPEWIVNSWDKKTPAKIWRIERNDGQTKSNQTESNASTLVGHQLGAVNGHGLAVGDLNGDGRVDVAFGLGWYEQPPSPWQSEWTLHRDWELHSSLPMIIRDIDGDGDNDMIFGAGHDYGLSWMENTLDSATTDAKPDWPIHSIDDRYSQVHTLAMADVDGDGDDELIAGKRFRAHNGRDPGGDGPPVLYYYDIAVESGDNASARPAVTFNRHVIDEGHVGCGLQIVAEDLDGDGDVDLATAGKSGTYVMINQSAVESQNR